MSFPRRGMKLEKNLRKRFAIARGRGLWHGLHGGYAKRGARVHDGNANLKLGYLSVEGSSNGPLSQQFHAVLLCLDAAAAVVSAAPQP